jgi:choline/glycine/proline betaine transport protein
MEPKQSASATSATNKIGPVFITSALLVAVVVFFGAVAPEAVGAIFTGAQGWIMDKLGWFYLLSVAIFVIFVLYLALSSFGRIKLGPTHSEPDFSYGSWFAMLFSAGMGIGLVFFGVAEPVTHFVAPPVGEGGTVQAASAAMRITFFHWGIHAWAIYAVIGLALGYFSFRHGLPLSIRSAFYPLIGERIHGPIGKAIDVFAVLGTVFGVATSLGLGVLQINAGLNHLIGLDEGLVAQVTLIALITGLATVSVVLGLDAGIRRLSVFNMVLAAVLLVFVALMGPTVFLLKALVQNIGGYLNELTTRTFLLYAYEPNDWISGWTLFYWAWWISWSPFVGMFIARISRGRTIREFVLGVLFVPTGFTLVWMTVFGNTAMWLHLSGLTTIVSDTATTSAPLALFAFLEQFPLATISASLATLLVVTFFVTSADSAALVIDTITSGGMAEPPVWRRVFWAVLSGAVAAVLLFAGGLQSLQTATIASALPFTVIMLLMCYGLLKALRLETLRGSVRIQGPATTGGGSWQKQLQTILHHPSEAEVLDFMAKVANPALEAVTIELRSRGIEATLQHERELLRLIAMPNTAEEFRYGIRARHYAMPNFAYFDTRKQASHHDRYYRAEVFLREGGQDYDVMGHGQDEIIADVLTQYERHLNYLHAAERVT